MNNQNDLSVIHEAWKEYEKSARTSEDKQKVIKLAKDNPETYWSIAFSQDPEMAKQMRLINAEHYAHEALKEYLEVPEPILLKMTAIQAWSWSKNDDNSIDEDLLAIWREVFKKTDFDEELKKVSKKLNLGIKP